MSNLREMESRVISRRVLLASLSPDTTTFESLVATQWRAIDWDWLIERATAHKVAALFAARFDQDELTAAIPERRREELAEIRQRARERAIQAQRTLQQAAQALAREGIPFLVIKGSVLAVHVYVNANIRPFYDVDLVVPPEMLVQGEKALGSLGYRFQSPRVKATTFAPVRARPKAPPDAPVPESVARQLYQTYHCHFVFVPPKDDHRLPLELHWHVVRPGILKVSPAELWEQTKTTVVAGTSVRTLNLEATLIYGAVHAMASGAGSFKLLHLCDVAWLVARFGTQVRRDLLWELADAWGARHYLDRALQASEEILGFRGVQSIKPQRKQSIWLRGCFRLAASERSLVDAVSLEGKLTRLSREVFQELFWELALCRLPKRAIRRVSQAVTNRLSRWKFVWLEAKGET